MYGVLYFVLVVFFTYFYTAFQFRPDQTADYLRKNGGFIPGIRPGKPTEDFLSRVTNRITLGGALFLASLAVLPLVVTAAIPGHAGAPARWHERPDRGQRGGRDDEAARGADADAPLRGLHPVTDSGGGPAASSTRRILLLVGPVGAGKGTQAEVLNQRLGLVHLASGNLFRQALRDGTPLGEAARGYMERGDLVPDEITIDMFMHELAKPPRGGRDPGRLPAHRGAGRGRSTPPSPRAGSGSSASSRSRCRWRRSWPASPGGASARSAARRTT